MIKNIEQKVPAAFSESRSNQRSDSYDFISSEEIMNTFNDNNWFPHTASQVRNYSSKKWNTPFAKHLITFQNPDLPTVNGIFPQINLINSHDGSTTFQLMAGLYRMVCSNGLIVSDSEFDSIKIRHRFLNPEIIAGSIKEIVDTVPQIIGKVDAMQSINMTEVDKLDLSTNVIKKIWTEDNSPFEAIQLLEVRRQADKEPNLWNTYNSIQENLVRGGIIGRTSTNKKRKMKGIINIDKLVKVNKLLWEESVEFLKAA